MSTFLKDSTPPLEQTSLIFVYRTTFASLRRGFPQTAQVNSSRFLCSYSDTDQLTPSWRQESVQRCLARNYLAHIVLMPSLQTGLEQGIRNVVNLSKPEGLPVTPNKWILSTYTLSPSPAVCHADFVAIVTSCKTSVGFPFCCFSAHQDITTTNG